MFPKKGQTLNPQSTSPLGFRIAGRRRQSQFSYNDTSFQHARLDRSSRRSVPPPFYLLHISSYLALSIIRGHLRLPSQSPRTTRSAPTFNSFSQPHLSTHRVRLHLSISALRRDGGMYPNALLPSDVNLCCRGAMTSSSKMMPSSSRNLWPQSSSSKPRVNEARMVREMSRVEVRKQAPFTSRKTISQLNISSNLVNRHDLSLITSCNSTMHSKTQFAQVVSQWMQTEHCQHSRRPRNIHLNIRNK